MVGETYHLVTDEKTYREREVCPLVKVLDAYL